jgi:hypothetical protein
MPRYGCAAREPAALIEQGLRAKQAADMLGSEQGLSWDSNVSSCETSDYCAK